MASYINNYFGLSEKIRKEKEFFSLFIKDCTFALDYKISCMMRKDKFVIIHHSQKTAPSHEC